MVNGSVMCPCCGFVKQNDEIKICVPFDDLSNIGVSTFLYFKTFKNLSILILIMFFIYAIFALVTNVIASGKTTFTSLKTNVDYLTISLGSKQLNRTS
jgi:hypothetical protein